MERTASRGTKVADMDTEQVGALILLLALSIVTMAYALLHFRNRRLSREVERLEAERESLIHRIVVQQEMMRDLASGDVGRKLSETYDGLKSSLNLISDCFQLYKIAHELKQGIDKNRDLRENKQAEK